MKIEGGCYCKGVRYRAEGEPIVRVECYCREWQYLSGVLEPKLFEAELNTLKWSITNPGIVTWWAANPISLSADYRAFIDGLIREAQSNKPQGGMVSS